MYELNISSKFRNYEVIIQEGLLDHIASYLETRKQYVLIHDDEIQEEYVSTIKNSFSLCLDIAFPAGEISKSFKELIRIIEIMQKNKIKRDSVIIALGGGVTGDLAGFIASIYHRGIEYVQIPTSLLAQIDASVGGKVAINTELAKNSLGNFYPPKMVLIDPKTLKTLPKRHFNNGIAEMIKYAMIASRDIFSELSSDKSKMDIEKLIYESLKIKKFFIEKDEFDNSIRQALNFGHTYGHAYEAFYKYNKYLHGEAVALGMIKATKDENAKKQLIELLKKFKLPTSDPATEAELIPYMLKDKKNTQKNLNMIFVNQIGNYQIIPVQEEDL